MCFLVVYVCVFDVLSVKRVKSAIFIFIFYSNFILYSIAIYKYIYLLLLFSLLVMSNSSQPYGLQHCSSVLPGHSTAFWFMPFSWVSFHKSMWVPASVLSENLRSLPAEQGGVKNSRLHMRNAPGNRKSSVSASSYCSCSNIRAPNFDDNQSVLTLQPFFGTISLIISFPFFSICLPSTGSVQHLKVG